MAQRWKRQSPLREQFEAMTRENHTGIDVKGVEKSHPMEKGPFGHPPAYTECLVVKIDGEKHRIPLTTIRTPQFPCYGTIPEVVNADRVLYDTDGLRVVAETPQGRVELLRRDGRWVCHQCSTTTTSSGCQTIWPEPEEEGGGG